LRSGVIESPGLFGYGAGEEGFHPADGREVGLAAPEI
jgi:hypothetical protein